MALTTFVAGQVLQAQQLNDSYAAVDWNENVVINGAMQVAQRGLSTASITTTGYYTADRFQTLISSAGTWTQTVESDAPTGSGFRNSLKMLCTTADASPSASDYATIRYNIEGQNVQQFAKGTASAKTFALSFWVKSNVTGTYVARLFDVTNSRSVSATYTVSASATWQKKSIVFPADTSGVIANNNSNGILIDMWLVAGSNFSSGTLNTSWDSEISANVAVGQTNLASAINNYWQITGVQLQPSRESQFLFQDYGTVLAQCQRYFQLGNYGFGKAVSATVARLQCIISPPMRAAASYTITNLTDFVLETATAYRTPTASSLIDENPGGIEINFTGITGMTTNNLCQINGIVQISAEL